MANVFLVICFISFPLTWNFCLNILTGIVLIIGRIVLNTVQDVTFLKVPVKVIKCCIQDFCFPRQICQTLLIGVQCMLYFLLNSSLLELIRTKYKSYKKEKIGLLSKYLKYYFKLYQQYHPIVMV